MSQDAILEDLAELSSDPLGFVLWAFPWGEPGPLANRTGPEPWQAELLNEIRDGLPIGDAIRLATASGHGVGKSALVAWIILWAFSTFEDTKGVVTANTETQLKTKTWAELGKWFHLFIAREFFTLTATSLYAPERERTWRIDQIPWSERSTEAFAGMHNHGKRIIMIMDEASNIPDVIWEVTEGALTDLDTQIIWAVFGNPTRNTGRFRECFDQADNGWHVHRVDSRSISFTNKREIARWVKHYGEDSDFVRVRVKGEFPRQGSQEFISLDDVKAAVERDAQVSPYDAIVMGVDVARFGDAASCIYMRQGRDAATRPPLQFRGLDTMQLAMRVVEEYQRNRCDAVIVDEGGVGGGVVDRLRQLRIPVLPVNFSSKPDAAVLGGDTGALYANKRAEMWGSMREWLKTGSIPNDRDLQKQLISPLYSYNNANAIQLERKEDMRKRGAPSPDVADALAITFAFPVMSRAEVGNGRPPPAPKAETEYDPFGREAMAA